MKLINKKFGNQMRWMPTMLALGVKEERQKLITVKCFAKLITERREINNLGNTHYFRYTK